MNIRELDNGPKSLFRGIAVVVILLLLPVLIATGMNRSVLDNTYSFAEAQDAAYADMPWKLRFADLDQCVTSTNGKGEVLLVTDCSARSKWKASVTVSIVPFNAVDSTSEAMEHATQRALRAINSGKTPAVEYSVTTDPSGFKHIGTSVLGGKNGNVWGVFEQTADQDKPSGPGYVVAVTYKNSSGKALTTAQKNEDRVVVKEIMSELQENYYVL